MSRNFRSGDIRHGSRIEVRRKTEQMLFLARNLLGGTTPTFLRQTVSEIFLSTVWQSLVEFRLLISVMQNLRTVGKNTGQF